MDDMRTPTEKIYFLARMMKILAEPNRLLIIDLLMKGTQCNCRLGEALQIAPNLISHHLGVLREAGLVRIERDAQDARWIYYSINQDAFSEMNKAFSEFLTPSEISDDGLLCNPDISKLTLRNLPISRG